MYLDGISDLAAARLTTLRDTALIFNPYTGEYELVSQAVPPPWFFGFAYQMGAL